MKHIPIQKMLNTALRQHQPGYIQNAMAGYQEILKKDHTHCDTLQTLDLVITVDTSVAHLARAMGVPGLTLLGHNLIDWRCLTNRYDSPRYPSAQLFRQPAPVDWPSAMETVKSELQKKLDSEIFSSIPGKVGA